jgi:micrococcal nuclease
VAHALQTLFVQMLLTAWSVMIFSSQTLKRMMSLRGAFVQRRIDLFEKLPTTTTGLRAFFLSCAALLFVVDGRATEFSTLVVSVIDGDTIEVLQYQKPERIRLNGIDCPEKAQTFGQRAKQATSELVFGKDVMLQTYGRDRHGHTIADVFLPDGRKVSQVLVKNGWCWWSRKYAPRDVILEELERRARADRSGLWTDPHPLPPWLYRELTSSANP